MGGYREVPAEYDAAIRELYPGGGSKAVRERFPELGARWICNRANAILVANERASKRQRRKGIRPVKPDDKGMDLETMQFVLACDAERRRIGRTSLKYSEILGVAKKLGYIKVATSETTDGAEQ